MDVRKVALLVAMMALAGGVVAFGFAGAAYSAPTSYSCPPTDNAGFAVGPGSDTTSNPIFCSYPAFSGENPDDFYCTYDYNTGALVTDSDAGFCPANAVASTSAATPCAAGYYSASGDDSDGPCTAASPGYYVSDSGATSQTPCPAGYYQPTSGASSCDAAAIGYYVASSGQANEVPCPAGETTLTVASTVCVAPTTLTAASVDKEPGLTVFSARLTLSANGRGLGGQRIVFKIGPFPVCVAVTAPNGIGVCAGEITLSQYLNATTYTVSYAGNGTYFPSTATGSFYLARPVLSIP